MKCFLPAILAFLCGSAAHAGPVPSYPLAAPLTGAETMTLLQSSATVQANAGQFPTYNLAYMASNGVLNGLGIGGTATNRSPMYVLNDSDPNQGHVGWNPGCRIMVGAEQSGTPGANNDVACTVYINNLHGRSSLWTLDLLALQAVGGLDGITHGVELEVNNITGAQTDPYAGNHKNGYEAIAHSSSTFDPTTAYMAWSANSNGTGWWYNGISLARVASTGIHFVINPGGVSDSGTAFTQAAIQDDSNSARVLGVTGSHSIFADISGATAIGAFVKGFSAANTNLGFSNAVDYDFALSINSGLTGIHQSLISLQDRGTDQWQLIKSTANLFSLYDAPNARSALTISPTTDAVTVNYGIITTATTVAGLPASPTTGQRGFVTDATACTFAATPTGGSSTKCPVYYDGSAWKEG